MIRQFFTKRMLIMLCMSFSSGLPITLILGTLQLWYAKVGVSIVAIGALTLVSQPYAYKFIWAPLMDRYVPPFLGRRRGWILITQFCLLISIFAMGLLNPQTHPWGLAVAAIVVAFFSASQDISLDAYRTDLLLPKERGVASAIWGNGYRLAMIVTSAAPLIIAYHVGWHVAYMCMALLMFIGIITTFFAPEPDSGVQAPANLKVAFVDALSEFLKRPYAWGLLLFIIVYKLGDAFALSLSSVFYLKGVGFNLEQIAWVGKTFGTVAGILGIIVGGALMVRWSLYKALMAFGWLQAVSILGFVVMAVASKSLPIFAAVVFFEHITGGMGTAAFLVLLMALCDKRFTATQYALFSAVMVIGRTFMGPIAGVTVEHYGWPAFFMAGFVFAVLGLALLWWLQRRIDFNQEQIR